jgi:hypothetical protein
VHDGISFEQFGKPALVICTEPFAPTGHNIARVLGLPDYEFALVEHPIGSRTQEEIAARAEVAYQAGLAILTGRGVSD